MQFPRRNYALELELLDFSLGTAGPDEGIVQPKIYAEFDESISIATSAARRGEYSTLVNSLRVTYAGY